MSDDKDGKREVPASEGVKGFTSAAERQVPCAKQVGSMRDRAFAAGKWKPDRPGCMFG